MGFEANTKSGGRKPETKLMRGLDGKDVHVFVSAARPSDSKSFHQQHSGGNREPTVAPAVAYK
jgi:hypothetical protein